MENSIQDSTDVTDVGKVFDTWSNAINTKKSKNKKHDYFSLLTSFFLGIHFEHS